LILFELVRDRVAKSLRLRSIEKFLIKRAVRTDARAEGNMNVKMTNQIFFCSPETF
jgi:hypothetical protein